MPNLTVSSAVDTMMQASNQAGIRAAIGAPGSDTQLLFNNAGDFGASSLLAFDGDTLAVSGANTAAPVLQVTMPASHADNAIEVLDSVGNVDFAVPVSPATGKYAIDVREFYSNTLRLQTHYRSVNLVSGSTPLFAWTYSGITGGATGGSCSLAHYFATSISQASNQEWRSASTLLGAINPNPTSVPTTALQLGNITSSVDAATDRTLMFGTCSSSATGNGRCDGTHLFLCTGDGAIAGTAAAADGGNVYVALGAGAGSGSGGDFIVRTLAGTDRLIVKHDGSTGFFGATPVSQPSGTGETTGFTAGSGTGVNDDSTFTGNVGSTAYRINDVVKALKNLGLLAG